MPADKPRPTLADYVTIVLSPALIIAMIVSLEFFLLTILYRGEFVTRLHYIVFFFTFGMVLVCRISMETGVSERAPVYGTVLAILVWLGMRSFVNYPLELEVSSWFVNALLIGVAWWLAYQLTYSCTYIDERAESTGVGVLQAAGLEGGAPSGVAESVQDEALPQASKRDRKRQPTWLERYRRFRAERRQTQPPGVWVVYFALAALPVFGLGQALIDVADRERRAYSFWLVTLYVASSLGLLVTTAFLGLRRYLRQRRLEMPKLVTTAWLVVGAGLVITFLVIGAVLPRPQAEFSPLALVGADSKEVAASKHAPTDAESGKGKGRQGAQERDPSGQPVARKDKSDEGKGGKGDAKGQGSGAKGKSAARQKESGDAKSQKEEGPKHDADERAESGQQAESPPWLGKAGVVLKWLVFGILALVTIFFVVRGGLRYLAHFSHWARRLLEALARFWESLFGGREQTGAAVAEQVPAHKQVPFRAFANPFSDGRAESMAPADLVHYTFQALEALARAGKCGREPHETPLEFTERVADEQPRLEEAPRHLGVLYARVLYARDDLPGDWRDCVEEFWRRVEETPALRR